jgi:uncharacterized protein
MTLYVCSLYEWFVNEWVHLVACDPFTQEVSVFRNGGFVPYETSHPSIGSIEDVLKYVESGKEMESNYIVDATQENLPIKLIKK